MPAKNDLTDQKFGKLLVIKQAPHMGGRTAWYCKCDCGNPVLCTVISKSLKGGKTKSCGCIKKEQDRERATDHSGNRIENYIVIKKCDGYWEDGDEKEFYECLCDCGRNFRRSVTNLFSVNSCGYCGRIKSEEIEGMKFGRLTALRYSRKDRFQKGWWWFRCECGTEETEICVSSVLINKTRSCGCLQHEARIKSAARRRASLIKQMSGKSFGMLNVIDFSRENIQFSKKGIQRKIILFNCLCDCGQVKECDASALKSGRTISCGCYERGKDSYHYFLEDEEWANSKCQLYYVEVMGLMHKLGISVKADQRAPNHYTQFFYKKDTSRAIARAIEAVALRWTIKFAPQELPDELKDWGGRTELREIMPFDKTIEILDFLFDEAEELGWRSFWEKYLPLNLIPGLNT